MALDPESYCQRSGQKKRHSCGKIMVYMVFCPSSFLGSSCGVEELQVLQDSTDLSYKASRCFWSDDKHIH